MKSIRKVFYYWAPRQILCRIGTMVMRMAERRDLTDLEYFHILTTWRRKQKNIHSRIAMVLFKKWCNEEILVYVNLCLYYEDEPVNFAREIKDIYCKYHMKHENTLCGQNSEV
jgi:hypothetical protein